MATNLVAKMGQNYLPPTLIALSIQNGMGYRDLNVRVISANDVPIPCKNFVNCDPVTPEKTGIICILRSWLNQEVLFNFNADLTGSGSVPICM